ncbi:hypothetical protein BC830DRAFT_1150997 [Chytriomyces sp. MP71]|nr:hypothetical protein BC830DRAFT_1150997 [Chytriomyces sp. MP71]
MQHTHFQSKVGPMGYVSVLWRQSGEKRRRAERKSVERNEMEDESDAATRTANPVAPVETTSEAVAVAEEKEKEEKEEEEKEKETEAAAQETAASSETNAARELTPKERLDAAKAFARATTVKLLLASSDSKQPITTLTLASFQTALQFPPSFQAHQIQAIHATGKIYIGGLHADMQESHLRQIFSVYGSIRCLSMSHDPVTGWGEAKHKGFAFVEFDFPETGVMAMEALNGIEFGGRPIRVCRPKDFNLATIDIFPKAVPERIFVANVNENIDEGMIKGIFEAFGVVKSVVLLADAITRKHRSCGYIQFTNAHSAASAVSSIKATGGLDLAGAKLHVCKSMVGGELMPGMKGLENVPEVPEAVKLAALNAQSGSIPPLLPFRSLIIPPPNKQTKGKTLQPLTSQPGMPALTPLPESSAAAQAIRAGIAAAKAKLAEENSSTLDEGNISINSSKRYEIMQQLMRRSDEPGVSKRPRLAEGERSCVLVLRNMVSMEDAADAELEGEIREECAKYGRVESVSVGNEVHEGTVDVTVSFFSVEHAEATQEALNGRFFAGRKVQADFKTT